jgi:hypothetical protein
MREDFVAVYGDRRRKVMQTVDKVEATCGQERLFSTNAIQGQQKKSEFTSE